MEKHTHSSEFMILIRMSTCLISCLEFSLTPSHMLMPCMKTVSKKKYLFYLRATLRYKYVGQSSEVNLLVNSPKQFMGLSDFPTQFFGQLSNKILLFWTTLRFNSCHALTPTILGCPGACEMQYANSQQFMLIYQACIYKQKLHITTKFMLFFHGSNTKIGSHGPINNLSNSF